MANPAPQAVLDEKVDIEYRQFFVKDEGFYEAEETPDLEGPADGEFLSTGADWIVIVSGAAYHVATARIEAWETAPSRQDDAWEISSDFQFTCTTGRLAVVTVTMGPASEDGITIGPLGKYHGRAYSKGRDEAQGQFMDKYEIDDGTEQYLIQFWPA
ncbi:MULTISPECIES: hypothetical protein [unclassified Pseudofrankia]|uniref:hypothetical protein n=1 Tax=unclassified Pseudofrankia TaxID=2994372 RepID=UPI0008D993B4|nr:MULTISPECIES: hypothetical protein [unclassified Pseudofrankia]MDT3439318.1 hypothetical protein [Pseudofrankia sp. BMG5.37]OHV73939.1 hypothetical protein BCD48_32880 [Pseudofrankia sp. BMG5.36]